MPLPSGATTALCSPVDCRSELNFASSVACDVGTSLLLCSLSWTSTKSWRLSCCMPGYNSLIDFVCMSYETSYVCAGLRENKPHCHFGAHYGSASVLGEQRGNSMRWKKVRSHRLVHGWYFVLAQKLGLKAQKFEPGSNFLSLKAAWLKR